MRYKNNPFNIRYSGFNRWKGLIGCDNGFCEFDTLEHGCRAAVILLRSYRKKGIKSVRGIITRFAPPAENYTSKYIDYVCSSVRIMPNDELNNFVVYAYILYYMAYFESCTFLRSDMLIRLCRENNICGY